MCESKNDLSERLTGLPYNHYWKCNLCFHVFYTFRKRQPKICKVCGRKTDSMEYRGYGQGHEKGISLVNT